MVKNMVEKNKQAFLYHYSSALDMINEFNKDSDYDSKLIVYAYTHLKRANEIDPENSDCYVYLSYCMYLCEKDNASKYYLSKAIELRTTHKLAIYLKQVFDKPSL